MCGSMSDRFFSLPEGGVSGVPRKIGGDLHQKRVAAQRKAAIETENFPPKDRAEDYQPPLSQEDALNALEEEGADFSS